MTHDQATAARRICVGQIATAHGIRGLVKLRSFVEDPDYLDSCGPLYTGEAGDGVLSLTLKNPLGDIWLAEVEGIQDRTAAERLRGTKLYLDRDKLADIKDEGTFYQADLVGLPVTAPDGSDQGTIAAVANFGAGDLLEIKPPHGPTWYLPFTESAVPTVDIAARRVVIVPPPEDPEDNAPEGTPE